MNNFQITLMHEIEKLDYLKQVSEKAIADAPKGRLRITHSNEIEQYYWRENASDSCGKYLKKSDHCIAKKLAQKDYAEKILPAIQKQRLKLQEAFQSYRPDQLLEVYQQLSISRKKLVEPYLFTTEEFAAQWEEEQKLEKVKTENNCETEIYTEKGERVRSKSEKILADKLYMMNIPYVYEVPLYLKGYGIVFPDFKVLNTRTRNELYWEHFGMMDNPDYVEKNIKKIELYEKNHIFPGSGLILTYETSKHPINTKAIESLVKEYLI